MRVRDREACARASGTYTSTHSLRAGKSFPGKSRKAYLFSGLTPPPIRPRVKIYTYETHIHSLECEQQNNSPSPKIVPSGKPILCV